MASSISISLQRCRWLRSPSAPALVSHFHERTRRTSTHTHTHRTKCVCQPNERKFICTNFQGNQLSHGPILPNRRLDTFSCCTCNSHFSPADWHTERKYHYLCVFRVILSCCSDRSASVFHKHTPLKRRSIQRAHCGFSFSPFFPSRDLFVSAFCISI